MEVPFPKAIHSLSQLQIGAYRIIHNLGLLHITLASEECCLGLEITQIKLAELVAPASFSSIDHGPKLTVGCPSGSRFLVILS
jgi:hypothetical protein